MSTWRFIEVPLSAFESDLSFHASFAQAFGFFDGYGHNMDAWLDSMSSLGEEGISSWRGLPGETIVLCVPETPPPSSDVEARILELQRCVACVNARLIAAGGGYLLTVALGLELQPRPLRPGGA